MFKILARDSQSRARAGILETAHGLVETPAFFPVATQAAVKTLSQQELYQIHVQGLLANTYHLSLRPGADVLEKAGGLHAFMGWNRPILTDSGGFQVMSLARFRDMDEDGVSFRSHHDGSLHRLTPERVMDLQWSMGSDILTCLDVCLSYPCGAEEARDALKRTQHWAERSLEAHRSWKEKTGLQRRLFGILQGSVYPELRAQGAQWLSERPFDGFAVGGLSVGEPKDRTWAALEAAVLRLPQDRPVYLMGVGTPEDIQEAVLRGVDLFDCVWPTRNARNGQVLSFQGKVYIKNACYKQDFSPLEPGCDCFTCAHYSRSYLCHLYRSGEMLAPRLLSLHNVHFLVKWVRLLRDEILKGGLKSHAIAKPAFSFD